MRRTVTTHRPCLSGTLLALALFAGTASAELDLRNATVSTLENGLTVVLLEDRNFPVASVQMLYRVGARNEVTGETGIAHFLEHMAFRATKNFPDTDVVSSIYAIGGEWHGYTWLDQTTYFSTVPKEQLDLLLRIEADRMSSLVIDPADMEAERGAVLAEMHMYENLPSSMLIDAVMFSSFLAHPYRNNTIGWESDIENLSHAAVLKFYEQHYHPANAVLAVAGDIDSKAVLRRVEELFGPFERRPRTPLPHTVEPLQSGERRVTLSAVTDERQFAIAYRAPSVLSDDFAAFLVLQEVLASGSGISFLQNDWGTAVSEGDPLYGAADNLATWFPPHQQDFLFVISGNAGDNTPEQDVERSIETRVARLREEAVTQKALALAVEAVRQQLRFDIETTEDAAHQLASFAAMDALQVLFGINDAITAVTPAVLQRVATQYLLPQRRTIAWHVPGSPAAQTYPSSGTETGLAPSSVSEVAAIDTVAVAMPILRRLGGGIDVIVQASDLSATAQLLQILSGRFDNGNVDSPIVGVTARSWSVPASELAHTITLAARDTGRGVALTTIATSTDPATRIEQEFATRMQSISTASPAVSSLFIVTGDVDADATVGHLQRQFGDLSAAQADIAAAPLVEPGRRAIHLGRALAQAHLGYIVSMPGPADDGFDASRLLLYILSHHYEGRLGKKAISDRGLAYYIDSRYRSDGRNAWATLSIGVDPGKIEELSELMQSEIARLLLEPPTITELEEAKSHFIGRARSAAQSNAELADKLAEDWLLYGDILTPKALERRLASISANDLLAAAKRFQNGATLLIVE